MLPHRVAECHKRSLSAGSVSIGRSTAGAGAGRLLARLGRNVNMRSPFPVVERAGRRGRLLLLCLLRRGKPAPGSPRKRRTSASV
jgi:hypothetical protein